MMDQIAQLLGARPPIPLRLMAGIPTAEEEALQPPNYTPMSLLPLLFGVGKASADAASDYLPALVSRIKSVTPEVMPKVLYHGFDAPARIESRQGKNLMTGVSSFLRSKSKVLNKPAYDADWQEWAQKTLKRLDKGWPSLEEDAPNVPGVSAFRRIPKIMEDARYPQDPKSVMSQYKPLTYLYRSATGKPLAGAEVDEWKGVLDKNATTKVSALAADPSSGLAGKRAAIQILKEIARLPNVVSDEDISPYTAQLLQSLLKRQKP